MSDTDAFTIARIIAPQDEQAEASSPATHRARLSRLLDGALGFLDVNLIPNAPETYHQPWTTLYAIHARRLRAQIRRIEHGLRCFILFLATELLKTGAFRAQASSQPAPATRALPQRRPYDPLVLTEADKPAARRSFTPLPVPSGPARGRSGNKHAWQPLDWAEIDAGTLIKRLQALPGAFARAEAHAERLAQRLYRSEFCLSSDEAEGPLIRCLDGPFAAHQARRPFPPFFMRLENWYPPPDLLDNIPDEDRIALTELHLDGCWALSACAEF